MSDSLISSMRANGAYVSQGSKAYLFYQVFKYTIYCLVSYNILIFFQDDMAASAQTFRDGITIFEIVEAFAATVDTVAWVALLLLFELETFILAGKKLERWATWTLHSVRGISYLFVCYASYGFIVKLVMLLDVSPFDIADTCSLIGSQFTYVIKLDDYVPISAIACMELNQYLNDGSLLKINNTDIITAADVLLETQKLSVVETLNSIFWILVVVVLEVDVYLKSNRRFNGYVKIISECAKFILYGGLLFNAIYWGFKGTFFDFWDAFLWLMAFVFIEMNLFGFHSEGSDSQTNS